MPASNSPEQNNLRGQEMKSFESNAKPMTKIHLSSGSVDAIAEDDPKQTPVRLTRFCPLPPLALPTITVHPATDDSGLDTRSHSASELNSEPNGMASQKEVQKQDARHRKWLWPTGKRPVTAVSPFSTPNLSSRRARKAQEARSPREAFQIVWRRLAFEVDESTYDQLIRQTIGGIMSLLPMSKASQESKSEEASSSFEQLSRPKRRLIFENLNGYVRSGEISAILGPSGSGKTSLLNAICGRVDNYRGQIQLIGGGKRRMRLSIIPQKDYLIENLTVRENLLYSSKILNTDDSNFDHEANIMRVVKMLNLYHCIEASAANISGGEYKRVSIAQELLRQPDILILDEPTSGLDSLNCKNLIKSLVQLIEASRQGTIQPIAIVMTIHQPDVEVFHMFDHVYCMARGGRVIFDGHPDQVLERIRCHSGLSEEQAPGLGADASNTLQCLATNPANLLIEIASEDLYGKEPIERLASYQRKQFDFQLLNATISTAAAAAAAAATETVDELADASDASSHQTKGQLLQVICNEQLRSKSAGSSPLGAVTPAESGNSSLSGQQQVAAKPTHLVRDKRLNKQTDHGGRFLHHTKILTSRAFTSTIRDPMMTMISMLFHLSIPFVMWTVYSPKTGSVKACPVIQREMDVVSMVSNNTMGRMEDMQEDLILSLECSTMFFLTTYSFSMCSLSIAALAFPLNMHVLLKEVRNGWYNLPAYVVAKTIANFPFEVLFPVTSLVMIYLMLGMPGSYIDWRIWAIALVMALISMISHTQGLIFGALCMDSVQTAIFLASASSLPLTLLSGFTARIKHMPLILQRLSWFSLYRYSTDAINIIRFGFGICPCDESTDEYLKTKEPGFTDIPDSMKPLFTYYLTSGMPEPPAQTSNPLIFDGSSNTTESVLTTTVSSLVVSSANKTMESMATSILNTTMTNSNNMTSTNATSSAISYDFSHIPGVSYDLTLNQTARNALVKRLESNEVDLFGRMADMMARSFTYGRPVHNCESVRSQLLTTAGAPKDEFLPILFGGMFGLLIAVKLILFLTVRFKIGSRT